ncbi:MAG: EAL and HDOD domain-containing protein [Eubacteriales bacterium]
MQVYVARQPIFNKNRDIIAYEILYRNPETKTAESIDGDYATSSVLMITSVLASVEDLLDKKFAFINFTKTLLCDNTVTLFSKDNLVVEILEDIVPDPLLLSNLKKLKEMGYTLALDDFTADYKYQEIIDLVDIIKVDFMLTTREEQHSIIIKHKREGLKFLAEKIETSEEFDLALGMGYDYFQGYYFAKPKLFNYTDIKISSYTCFKILDVLSGPSPNYDDLTQIVETDVALSYKLFKYANSPIYGGRTQLTSIKDALVRLGFQNIHDWIYLIVLRSISQGQSNDLVSVSLQRAKMLESLAVQFGHPKQKSEYFITGLFSLVDVLTNLPMQDAIKDLQLSHEIKSALLFKSGALGKSLNLIIAYESGNWQSFEDSCKTLRLKVNTVISSYFSSLEWAKKTLSIMDERTA